MKFRQWLGKKIAGGRISNGALTDADREKALAIRRQETALRQAEKQVEFLERLQNLELQANPKESVTDSLLKQALPILLSKIANEKAIPQTINTSSSSENIGVEFTDEQITHILKTNPKLKLHADKFNDTEIKEYLQQQVPNISKASIERIILKVRQ